MKEQKLTEGNVLQTLVLFAIPFLIANVLQSLYGAVDLFVIGRFCDAQSIAAVSTGTQVTQIITSAVTGLTLGGTILIGQFKGAGDMKRVRETIGTTLSVFAIVAVILTILMIVFIHPLLAVLSTPQEAFALTMQYVIICALGNIFVCGYNAISAILRGYGDSLRPMLFVAIACIINIVLDFVFVGSFGLGVSGTALATIIAQGVSMVIAVIYLKKSDFIFDFRLKSFRIVPQLLKKLAWIGIPISFQELMVRISFLYLMAVMNSCGVYAASVVGISSKYDVFAMLSATSMANALAAITAHNMGAGKPKRARQSLRYGVTIAVGISFLFWLWAQLNPQSMIRVFTDNEAVVAAGVPFFKSCSYDYLMVAFVFCLNGYLNGREKTVWTMISCTAGALLLRMPLVYFFAKNYGGDLGMLGKIAPLVSGVMAVYTFAYVVYDACREKRKKTLPV